ncbi:MAG: HD domain-containing protein [Defluviitaleaceae bacterium]|nr:HD domain-containing protein [Defluviitaleaceae bacterium]
MNILNKMLSDIKIIDAYSTIAKKEISLGEYTRHDFGHVKRVMNNCEKIAQLLRFNHEDAEAIKIAALLHDIGCLSGGKDGHAERSAEWASVYLQDKGLSQAQIAKIIIAISEHSGRAESVYGKILVFADKIDITAERLLPNGLLIAGNRQYGHIKAVDFTIQNQTLKVNFISDGKIDIIEMNEYYFTKKVYQSIADLSLCFGLSYKIMIDGAELYL